MRATKRFGENSMTAGFIMLLLTVSVQSLLPIVIRGTRTHSLRVNLGGPAPPFRNGSVQSVRTPPLAAPQIVGRHEHKWITRFEQLQDFIHTHGHCNPSPRGDDFALAMWIKNQRMNYKYWMDGVRPMSKHRIDLLNSIGFIWSVQDAKWMQMYGKLVEFYQVHGHADVPSLSHHNCKSEQLARWVAQQRLRYKRATNMNYRTSSKSLPLSEEQVELLEKIQFPWHPRDDVWWKRFNDLKAFKATHGHCNIPQRYTENPELGTWCHHQRRSCKEYVLSCMIERKVKGVYVSGLNDERLQALREIDFCWFPEEPFSLPPAELLDSWYVTTL